MPRRFADVTDRFDQPGSNRAKALLAVERLPECRSVGKAFLFEQLAASPAGNPARWRQPRSEEHTSELQSLMRISYAVFCLKNKSKKLTLNCSTQLIRKYLFI